ncbi:hypothetical protein BD779DRAFT_1516875 [Infundibulicybe gibba]|nr:hypothetical protein BD779DRAFT_1516875 [Infundibulicybe gibba]
MACSRVPPFISNSRNTLLTHAHRLYITRIFKLAPLTLRSKPVVNTIFAVIFSLYAASLGAGIAFVVKLMRTPTILSFTGGFQWVIYLFYGISVLVDATVALVMCFLLHRTVTGIKRTDGAVARLIQYTISSGALTSVGATTYIVLCLSRPQTLLYLGMEFSLTRLYANCALAMYNARNRLRESLGQTVELNSIKFTTHDDRELPSNCNSSSKQEL